jgi:tripartite-type tricarboxylate transporter receptor subunit TctC
MRVFSNLLRAAVAALALAGAAASVQAQSPAASYPTRAITLIVPFPAGNVSDMVARLVGTRLSASVGQPVVVENVVGGSGIVGMRKAARATPDGYTIVMSTAGAGVIVPSTHNPAPYDLEKDFEPITMAAPLPFFLLVHPSVPAQNLKELLQLAKAQPGALTYASLGVNSAPHLAMEILKKSAGIDMLHVPYPGSAQASNDLLANRVNVMFDTVPPSLPMVRAGKLRALAVSTDKRATIAPEIPTIHEAGVPGYDASAWTGFFAPAGTPKEIVRKLHAEMVAILTSPDVVQRLTAAGLDPVGNTPEQFGAFVKAEKKKWAEAVAGVKDVKQ